MTGDCGDVAGAEELLAKVASYDGRPICPRCGDGFPVCPELRRAGVDISEHGIDGPGCGCPFYEWSGTVCERCDREMDQEMSQ